MSQIKRPALRITKRQYSRFKQTLASSSEKQDTQQTSINRSDLYQQMFERNRAVKLIIDPSTTQIINANHAACAFYGYTHEQITSLCITDISTITEPALKADVQRTIAEKGTQFQTRHRLSSGEIRDVEIFTGLLDIDGKTYLYAIIQDISTRLQAEKALRESEKLYRLFARHMPNTSVFMFDHDMRYTLAEGPFLKRFGSLYENITGKTLQEILPREVCDFLIPIHQRALQGESFSYERVLEDYAYQAYVTPVRDDSGNIIGGMILSHDMTDVKRAEAALRASEARLRLIIDNITDLVTYDDVKGNFLYVSPSSWTMLGYQPDSLVDTSSIEFVHPADRMPMTETLSEAMKTGTSQFTLQGRFRHADGHYINIETVGKLLTDNGSNYTGGVFITRDITQRKRLQQLEIEREVLQTALDKEREFSTLKTDMMQRIAHEFRTPLTVIQTLTETLSHYWERLNEDQRTQKTETIKEEIHELTNILDEISLVVKNTYRSYQIYKLPTDVSDLCRKIALDLEHRLNLPDKYMLDFPQQIIAPVELSVFEKAVFHVLRNAAIFSEPETKVRVSLVTLNKKLELRIMDDGIGILPHEQHRIFDAFFRGSNINEVGGMGIGLTIARSAIEAHGGTIAIVSALGQGTSATITLPV